ncbi:MAG: hypothetical protein QNJ97_22945 [Myxococcota bacterium]|nr:hypothetical protein [Myxococcota bacterium]
MKSINEKQPAHKLGILGLISLIQMIIAGCGPEFDDPTMAVLKRPEILSIVLEPPEAAPGETVKASFLMADRRGVIQGNANVWLPTDGSGEASESEMVALLDEMGLDLESLGTAAIEFQVPLAGSFTFDEDGRSGLTMGLFAAIGSTPSPQTPVAQILETLDSHVERGDVKSALRTLVVSERADQNQNPLILGIVAGDKQAQNTRLAIARSEDSDIAATRQLAADNPLTVKAEQEVVFAATVQDDGNPELSLRYQWISTGGDFGGLRERVQAFEVPKYKQLSPGEMDQTGQQNVDPRLDPNLHPVWLIARDNGTPGALGQSWAEFYIRVTPLQ